MRGAARLLILLLCLHAADTVAQSGVLTARVWGLAKYHHPQLVTCAVDWDKALLDRWSTLEAATTPASLDAALEDLLAVAGSTPGSAPHAGTPGWITRSPLNEALQRKLAWLADQRPTRQCKVAPAYPAGSGPSQVSFDADNAHATSLPDRAHRALAALRYWNAIEYFFPYKPEIGRDWADVLAEHLPRLLDAEAGRDFTHAMRRFSAEIMDAHGHYLHPFRDEELGAGSAPFAVRPVEGRTLVVRLALPAEDAVRLGDELLAVDGEPMVDRIARLDDLWYGSNPAHRLHDVHRRLTNGSGANGLFRLRREDGSEYEVSLPRSRTGHPVGSAPPPMWRIETLPACRIGVIDIRIAEEQIGTALQALANTDALLFDMRNYPRGEFLYPLLARLFDRPQPISQLTFPDLSQPGRFFPLTIQAGGGEPIGYRGRLLILQNEEAISASEYAIMGLQADGRAITFGSQTAGADGNITWVDTPGDLQLAFSGLGVLYPDGRDTQRVGIVPDVHVAPTRQGLAEGRDEVLERALDCSWLDAPEPRRRPVQGLYAAPERDGEGIDVQLDRSGTIAVFSYHYDAEGQPEWLLSVDNDPASGAQRGFAEFDRAGAVTLRDGYLLDFHRGPYFPACAISDQSALHPRARWQFPAGTAGGESCMLPLLADVPGPASGTYAGTGNEEGWGVSLHQAGEVLAVVVYAYDGAGRPRWLLSHGTWSGDGSARLALQRARGYCQGCPARPIELVDAGQLELVFGDLGSPEGHRLSIDADFGDGVRWVREDMPLQRISRPPTR